MPLPGKATLLDYARRSFAAEEQALAAVDDQQYQELRLHEWATTQTVGNFLMTHFVHEREHFGMMQYLEGLQALPASKSEAAAH